MSTITHIRRGQSHFRASQTLGSGFDNGAGDGNDGTMEARILALEKANLDTRDRLMKIETKLDTMATREDLQTAMCGLHQEMAGLHKEMAAQTWRLVTFVCGFGSALVAVTYAFAKYVH